MSTPTRPAQRMALVYVAVFMWMGTYLPYWPVWLADRGMTATQVGLLLGTASWTRLVSSPIAGRFADRRRNAHRLVSGLAFATSICFVAFHWAHGFWTLAALMVVLGLLVAPIIPLIDGIALGLESRGRLSYGPVRLWGSVAFIAASWLGGVALEAHGDGVVWWLLMGAAGLVVGMTLLLPRPAAASPEPEAEPTSAAASSEPRAEPTRPSVAEPTAPDAPEFSPRSRPFVAFLLIATLLHLSHAVLYAFGTQHWRGSGLDESTVGLLWAESVVAEIILFALAPRLDRWLSSRRLWLAAAIAGAIRWTMLAGTVALPGLVVAQALHGLTFGALHLGAMRYLRRHVPEHARGHATTLYSAAGSGLALGIGLPLAGVLYGELQGGAYWAMAACSALAALLLLVLRPSRSQTPNN